MLSLSQTNKIKEILLNSGPAVPGEQVSLSRDIPYLACQRQRTSIVCVNTMYLQFSHMQGGQRLVLLLSSAKKAPGCCWCSANQLKEA